MPLRPILALFVLLLVWNISSHAADLTYSTNCQQAYQYFLQYRITDARALLQKEITEHPSNVMPYLLFNYEEFVNLCLNEDPAAYKTKRKLFRGRLALLEKADHESPYYLFWKGLLCYQWSMIDAKHTRYTDAALNFRKSLLYFRECRKKHPGFKQADVFIGLQESLVSTIPKGYKWIANILGLNGNLKTGLALLHGYLDAAEQPFREEAQLYAIYLKNYLENDPEGAIKLIGQLQLNVKSNPINAFVLANLYLNNKNAQKAETVLTELKPPLTAQHFPMLDYELADAKWKRVDLDAERYYELFLKNYRGYFYRKDAHYQLALLHYLKGNTSKATQELQLVKTDGYAETDADKQALRQATRGLFPKKELLRARLLNDGGYHQEALRILKGVDVKQCKTISEQLEFPYRMARVYDDLGEDNKALPFYEEVIRKGQNESDYFAARSALQIGFIYEKRNQKAKALEYFNKVLLMEDHDYKNSLDQRAKAGIGRCK
jgi:hypothetical protein